MSMKIFPVSGVCAKEKRKFGLQLVNANVGYTVGGIFKKTAQADVTPDIDFPELNGDVSLGSFAKLGCPFCKQKHLYVCPHCQQFICYDGNETTTNCPNCGEEVSVPASDGKNVSWGFKKVNKKKVICMLFDVSGSMRKGKLEFVVNSAINNFINKMGPDDKIIVGSFGNKEPDDIQVVCPLTSDKNKVLRSLNTLKPTGKTPQPLEAVLRRRDFASFRNESGDKSILFFTDGHWDGSLTRCKEAAQALKDKGIVIIGIGTLDADEVFMKKICTQNASFVVSDSEFDNSVNKAFKLSYGQ